MSSVRENITAGVAALLDAEVKAHYTATSPSCSRVPRQPADLQPEECPYIQIESVSERCQDMGNGIYQGLLRLNVWGILTGPFQDPDTQLNALLLYFQAWLLFPSPLSFMVSGTTYTVSVAAPEPNESYYSDQDAVLKFPVEIEYYFQP